MSVKATDVCVSGEFSEYYGDINEFPRFLEWMCDWLDGELWIPGLFVHEKSGDCPVAPAAQGRWEVDWDCLKHEYYIQ